MSSTITCKRVACAFRDANDETIFVLGEVAYESNVYPHTRRIHPVAVGNIETVMQKIFDFAHYVEGGMLTSPSRKLTPESYIKSWLLALRKPHYIDPQVKLNLDHICSWNKDAAVEIRWILAKRGLAETLYDAHAIIQERHAMFAISIPFSDKGEAYTELADGLGYAPKAKPDLDFPFHVVRLPSPSNQEIYFLRIDEQGNGIDHPHWAYKIIGDFVSELWQHELHHPGSYAKLIPNFRAELNHLPPLYADHVQVTVPDSAEYQHLSERYEQYRQAFGSTFRLSVVPVEDHQLYHVLNSCLLWKVPDQLWAIYSPNEAATSGDGAGFWDNDLGSWVGKRSASVFSDKEKGKLRLPISLGNDARWVPYRGL